MMLDPVGKVYYSTLNDTRAQDVKYYFGYGFYQHRRREQAILVGNAVAGRLRQAASKANRADKSNYSHVITLRDAANAFPSVSHDSMRATIGSTADVWDTAQMCARHEKL